MSIKKFIIIWMGGLAFCFVIMAVFLILTTNRLQSMNARVLSDTRDMDLAQRLETAILAERQEDLLWRFAGGAAYGQRMTVFLDRAIFAADQLVTAEASGEEAELIKEVEGVFARFREIAASEQAPALEKISPISQDLLRAAEKLRSWEQVQMAQTLASSTALDRTVDFWSNVLIILVFLIMAGGAILLMKRIVLPIFALSQATAKFGHGDFNVRAEVIRDDEFGLLCGSFNSMAENIQTLQEERLHFIAAVAHDLKNPLILVGATARRLKKKLTIAGEQMELVDRLIAQSGRTEEMISDLMESVRMQTGKPTFNLTEIDLDVLLNTIYGHQAALIASHELAFEGQCRCWISGDARRLERVLANLISNAVKYSPSHSLVRIKTERRGPEAVISVVDEGAGIAATDIPSLFQPFRRLAHTRDMAKGAGLGLFSVKKIIEGHGGTIAIESALGHGTTVTITLPIVRGA